MAGQRNLERGQLVDVEHVHQEAQADDRYRWASPFILDKRNRVLQRGCSSRNASDGLRLCSHVDDPPGSRTTDGCLNAVRPKTATDCDRAYYPQRCPLRQSTRDPAGRPLPSQ